MTSPQDQFQTAAGRTDRVDFSAMGEGPKDPAGPQAKKTHRTARPVLDHGSRKLSKKQIIVLAQLARQAFNFQRDLGLVDDGQKFDDWRHQEQLAAVGQSSLKDCRQHHYVYLRGHFTALRSGTISPTAFSDLTTPSDDADRQGTVRLLRKGLAALSQASNPDRPAMGDDGAERYALAIARNQSRGVAPTTIDALAKTWSPEKIECLAYTLLNRSRAISGTGSTAARNKSQRGGKSA